MFFTISCSETITDNTAEDKEQDLTLKEVSLKNKLQEAAQIVGKLVQDHPSISNEIQFAVKYYMDEQNFDERVLFKDLLDQKAEYKRKWKANTEITFATAFTNNLEKSKDINASSDLIDFLEDENVTIYFPYSIFWEDEEIFPTISYDPVDNEHVNEGFKPIKNQTSSFDTVTVNDSYAKEEPTFIITKCEEGTTCVRPPEDGGGGELDPPEKTGHKVQIGWAKLTKQLDGLFAGGSEVRWVSVDGIKYNNEVDPELKQIRIAYDFPRAYISQKVWVPIFSQFDQNWEDYELARDFIIYEADGNGLTSLSLEIKVDLGSFEPTFGLDYELSKKRDDLITTSYQRDLFIAENNMDLGHGLKEGTQIRHTNGLYWTMPITEINY